MSRGLYGMCHYWYIFSGVLTVTNVCALAEGIVSLSEREGGREGGRGELGGRGGREGGGS